MDRCLHPVKWKAVFRFAKNALQRLRFKERRFAIAVFLLGDCKSPLLVNARPP
jgi:hypothetical protein